MPTKPYLIQQQVLKTLSMSGSICGRENRIDISGHAAFTRTSFGRDKEVWRASLHLFLCIDNFILKEARITVDCGFSGQTGVWELGVTGKIKMAMIINNGMLCAPEFWQRLLLEFQERM